MKGEINMPLINLNPISLTLKELINNPLGKKSYYGARRSSTKEDLERRYRKMILKHKTFKYIVYKENKNYFFHFKIPSETYDELMYDVIIEFVPTNLMMNKDRTLNSYTLKLFSNAPAFMFIYTYVVNNNRMLADHTKEFCADKALKQAPKVTNPVEVYGFEKSIYFASLFILENELYNKFNIDRNVYKLKKDTFKNSVTHQEDKFIQYNKKKKEAKQAERNAKRKKANQQNEIVKKQLANKKKKATTSKKKTVKKKK